MDDNTKLAPSNDSASREFVTQEPIAGSALSQFGVGDELPTPKQLQVSFPKAWYLFGTSKELASGPVTKELLGQRLVGFQTDSGKTAVMNSRCSHLGSDLGEGCVVGESIQCPFHGWEYGVDGKCSKIPASEAIPAIAKQSAFATHVLHGNVYFFNASKPAYPLPFFEGIEPDELIAAVPFVFEINAPWYMVGSNGVDVQHFQWAHDRKLLAPPSVKYPQENLHRTTAKFTVVGNSFSDRLTKFFGGSQVTLKVDDWSSTHIATRSTLAKTESFGLLSATPISMNRTRVSVTAYGWKNKSPIGRLFDPLSARLRRYFIREFLREDVALIEGTDFSPHSMMDVDQQYVEYMQWVASLPR